MRRTNSTSSTVGFESPFYTEGQLINNHITNLDVLMVQVLMCIGLMVAENERQGIEAIFEVLTTSRNGKIYKVNVSFSKQNALRAVHISNS